jgi:hypothetical protein
MFLTIPAIGELQNLDSFVLIDMLAKQTAYYTNLIKDEGFSDRSESCRQIIGNIQAAIEISKDLKKNVTGDPSPNYGWSK